MTCPSHRNGGNTKTFLLQSARTRRRTRHSTRPSATLRRPSPQTDSLPFDLLTTAPAEQPCATKMLADSPAREARFPPFFDLDCAEGARPAAEKVAANDRGVPAASCAGTRILRSGGKRNTVSDRVKHFLRCRKARRIMANFSGPTALPPAAWCSEPIVSLSLQSTMIPFL
jgi:hypothetical protein